MILLQQGRARVCVVAPASSTVTSLFGSLPMSMELAPVSADRMADILHTLRTTKYEVKGSYVNIS